MLNKAGRLYRLLIRLFSGVLILAQTGCTPSPDKEKPLFVSFELLNAYESFVDNATVDFEKSANRWNHNQDSVQFFVMQLHDTAQFYNQNLRRQRQKIPAETPVMLQDSMLDTWRAIELKKLSLEYNLFAFWKEIVQWELNTVLEELLLDNQRLPQIQEMIYRDSLPEKLLDSIFEKSKLEVSLQESYASVLKKYAQYLANINEVMDFTNSRKTQVMVSDPNNW